MTAVTLDPQSIEAVAARVVELLRGEDVGGELIDAAEVARRFNTSRDFVYSHARELGAVRLGDGSKPRLRFDPEHVAERLISSGRNVQTDTSSSTGNRRPRKRQRSSADLLPVRGSDR